MDRFYDKQFFVTEELATGDEPNTQLLAQANHETHPGDELSY